MSKFHAILIRQDVLIEQIFFQELSHHVNEVKRDSEMLQTISKVESRLVDYTVVSMKLLPFQLQLNVKFKTSISVCLKDISLCYS